MMVQLGNLSINLLVQTNLLKMLTMKKIYTVITIFSAALFYSQVAIGKTSVSNSSVSLEFYDGADNAQGLLLPWVSAENDVQNPVNGTFIFDTTDKKVKVYDKGVWFDLTRDTTGVVDTSLQDNLAEAAESKVFLGENPTADTTNGILVLGDTNKAMILPQVANPHLTIINPEPGTMAYDTVSDQLAVYNGTVWSFWKP